MNSWPHVFRKLFVVIVPSLILDDIPLQVQNASDLLIKPLEKFRKEQIGLTKVSGVVFFFANSAALWSHPEPNYDPIAF